MKNLLSLLVFCFAITANIQAQVSLSLSGGANYSNYKFSNSQEFDENPLIGYFFNANPGYQMSEKIKLYLGIQYSERGYELVSKLHPPSSNSTENKFRYLEFLPEVEYTVSSPFSIGLGFNYALKLSEQIRNGDGPWITSGIYDIVKSKDIGLFANVKFNYKSTFLFIRYTKGLVNVSNIILTDENGNPTENGNQYSSCFQFGIGVNLYRNTN